MKFRSTILSLSTASALLIASGLHAQDPKHCGTDEARQRLIAHNPDLVHQEAQYELGLQEYLQARAGLRSDSDTVTYVLPVVFHVLYDPVYSPAFGPVPTSDTHNISDAQIFNEMNNLNKNYNLENTDTSEVVPAFKDKIGNIHVHFQLATKDPFGNCTNGIDRITSHRSFNAGDFSKLDPWFRDRYINVWVVQSLASQGSFAPAGYSQLPPDVQGDDGSLRDGVILLHNYVGDDGTSEESHSRTLTHEIGHYLNLEHTWGGGNSPGVACGDDGVDDTPFTKGHDNCNPPNAPPFYYLTDFTCSSQPLDTVYTFADVTTSSGSTDPTPVPTVFLNDSLEPGLELNSFSAVGLSANSAEDSVFAFSQWDGGSTQGDTAFAQLTGSLNTSKYYQFQVTPVLGKAMTVTGLTFGADRSDDGPRTFAVRSSIDNFSANLSASVAPADTALSLPGSNVFFFAQDTTGGVGGCTITVNYSHLTGPVTFRIYAWNAEDASGSFSVDSVKVNGQFGVIENTQNYMEYSYCTHMFTMGQGDRMRAALNSTASGRSNLWQDGNHAFTGIDGYEQTCGPQADFYTLDPFVCVGATVQFKDNSGRATPTSWAWSFEGGNPATSNEQNPTVTFAEPGYHAVTLTCGNEYGSSSVTKTDVVNIGPAYSQVGVSLNEPFNTAGALSQWPNKNWENNSTYWNWNGQVGHDAPGCAMLNASATFDQTQDIFGFPGTFFADKDLLLTPMLDLRFLTDGQLNFWYAYATQTPTVDDITESLKVWSSTDCGETWSQRRAISGADLVTAGIASPGYVPGAGDWQQVSIALSSIFSTNNVRFAFEFTSGFYSNDIYLDDVNITGSNVGIDELAQNGGMVLMPNPASDHLSIALDLGAYEHGTLSFLDMTGRIIHEQAVAAGQQQLEFDLRKMGITSGVYLVQIKHANGQRVERLVVR